MKCLIWLCILQFVFFTTNAQSKTDSLRALLSRAQVKRSALEIQRNSSQLAWIYISSAQYDSALKYYYIGLHAILSGSDPRLTGNLMIGLGTVYNAKGNFDSCIFYYRSALDQFTIAKDTTNSFVAESNLSMVYKDVGLYEEALKAALHVVSRIKEEDNSLLKGSCYNTIGSIYSRTRDYPKALEYYRLALQNRSTNKQPADIARIRNNIGELYILMHKYDSATSNLRMAVAIKQEINDMQGLSRTMNNIGKVSMLTGDFRKAEKEFEEALTIQKGIDDPVGMIEVLNNMGELNLHMKRVAAAGSNLDQAARIIFAAGTPEYLLRQNLELQIKLDRERHDFASGMQHLEQLSVVRDSLLNEEKNRSMQAMQIRYETQKKEQQIAMLEQQEEINQNRIRSNQILIGTLILGLVLVTAVGLLAYFNFRIARTAKQRIELLLADTRHRIKNNLQTLASIFHLQTKHYTDHNMVLEAKSSESRVHAMSLLHQKFYAVGTGHTIDLRKYITDLVNQLVEIYGFRSENTAVTIDVHEIHLDIDKALPLSLIVQELVSNAFKYAFEKQEVHKLTVSIYMQSNGDLLTTVADNGAGMDISQARSSQGFSLVEAFVAQLDGNLQVRTEEGTTFTISFPLTPLWKRHAS